MRYMRTSIKDILKTNDIIKIDPDETIATALKLLQSSHDSAFVFEKDDFLGIVNPYHALIQKSYPSNTKVRNGLVHPPKLTFSHDVIHAAKMMIESKIHYLPVFHGKKFAGILSARRIMKNALEEDGLRAQISKVLSKRKKLHTISAQDYLSKALPIFKKEKVSKLVVVDEKGKIAGMLAYYDIIDKLAKPKQRQSFASRQGQKNPLLKKAVKNFHKAHVLTLSIDKTLRDAAEMMLDKRIGSVVIVDKGRKPVEIVTTKDILTALDSKKKPVLAELHKKNLSKTSQLIVDSFVKSLNKLLLKAKHVKHAEVTVSEKKRGGVFEAVISIFSAGKKAPKVVRVEDTSLRSVLQDIRKKAKRVLDRK